MRLGNILQANLISVKNEFITHRDQYVYAEKLFSKKDVFISTTKSLLATDEKKGMALLDYIGRFRKEMSLSLFDGEDIKQLAQDINFLAEKALKSLKK